MRSVACILIASLLAPAYATAAQTAAAATVADVVAIPPPVVTMSGHIMMKDGVTPVSGAVLMLTGAVDGEPRLARAARTGRFKVKLPAGQYRLQITRRMEIYKAPAVFRVPASGDVEIDLLLLPDFEPEPAPAPKPKSKAGSASAEAADPPRVDAGPDPVPTEPLVVGSVVDMVHSKSARRWSRWAEALGFLGGMLAVAVAAD